MIDASDLRAAGDRLVDQADDVFDGAIDELGDAAAAAIAKEVRAGARRHRRSGRLERNVRVRQVVEGGAPSWSIKVGGMVAPLIVGGTSPHTIGPVRSRALELLSPGGALTGFAGVVHHPGTRADPFVARGFDRARGDVARLAADTIDTIAADLADVLEG